MNYRIDPAELARSIRDDGRIMLRPCEERALAIRLLTLEGVCSAAERHRDAVVLANALKGGGDTTRDVQRSFETLRAQIEVADKTAAAMRAARPRNITTSPRRNHPLRQLTRWWRTMLLSKPKPKLRRSI
ncbi:hypothetical protein [Pyruvatibacter sp.]|uniref:hypothetical protein n=1 Tax=Pyruvatibacter sp. TaxID=1981328 RepID=UPI0032EB61D7